ncbi:MAG TPA: gas vesicle protein GvpO [Kribbella sp.]
MATARDSEAPSTAARRRPAKKTAAKKAAPQKAAGDGRRRPDESSTSARSSSDSRTRSPHSLRSIALAAAAELSALIGQQVEGIIGIDHQDDGWRVQVEVIETRRIPDTTDILAIYEVDVDTDGTVTGYRRLNRYVRGRFED